ncbi:MAG: acetoacetyl-CoA synthetase [Candidatus Krumholzibacteriia bacterium]
MQTDDTNSILWEPDTNRIAAALVTKFRQRVSTEVGVDLADYNALYAWSVGDSEQFWRQVWAQCGVVGDGPGETTVVGPSKMPGARWFPESRLNYAENLLAQRTSASADENTAIVFRGEDNLKQELTWGELRRQSAAVAAALKAEGVLPGDRVVGFLPNIPQAIIAMLGATSLGAVWSSCSPDFGVEGVVDRFGQIEPKVLLTADGYSYGGKSVDSLSTVAQLMQQIPSLSRCVVVPFLNQEDVLPSGYLDNAILWDNFLAPFGNSPATFVRLPFDHPLFIMYSSGTTGLPKCMVHSAGGTLLQHLKEHQLHCDLRPGDRIFYFTTCGWMMWNWLVTSLASEATVMLYDGHPLKPANAVWDFAAEEKFTILGTSARWVAACEKSGLKPNESHDLASLRSVLSTGSPLSPESFDYVYRDVKADVQLSSISGGTDIVSCFALGSPVLPVRRGQLQCRGLGMAVSVWQAEGQEIVAKKGELVCTAPFPSMPTSFWDDEDGSRYHNAYFAKFSNVWCHGDFAELTPEQGLIIHGRSDTVLNPGGVRIGTAEIYRVVEQFAEVEESLLVGIQHSGDVTIALFVKMMPGKVLDEALTAALKQKIRADKTPRHVPGVIKAVPDIPRTRSGKIVESAVRNILHNRDVDNEEALANPESLAAFRDLASALQAELN